VRVSDNGEAKRSIVGLWAMKFVAENSPGTPDGALVDWGYVEWHSDGTEIMNSGGHAPATENFCMGVWARTGPSSYKLNHYALSYDATTGLLAAYVHVHEQVTVDPTGNQYSGSFTINVTDPNGNPLPGVAGVVSAQRLTADE
jgi:hypothetical protein